MSSGSQPSPPSPYASASAQAQAQLAGEMFNAQNAPVEAYGNAVTSAMLSPFLTQQNTAQNEQAAYNQAAGNQAIEYATNPQAYQARQMQLQGANNVVGSLYGTPPSQYSFSAPSVFQTPNPSSLPSASTIGAIARAIASQMGGVSFQGNNQGGISSVSMTPPSNPVNVTV